MAPIILFTFGPEESFCFYSPTKTINHRTNYAFTKTIPPRLHLPYSVSLGPADNEYCAFYVGRNHELNYSINILTSKNLRSVVDFLVACFKAQPQDLLRSRLVLGPAGTFIAITPSAIRWDVANPLRDLMTIRGYGFEGSEKPKEGSMITDAALGHGGAWWVRFENGTDNWDFDGGYRELEQLLKGGDVDPKTIKYLALSPFSSQHYFLVYEGNKVRYSLPAAFAQLIGPAIDEYHASLVSVSGAHPATGGLSVSTSRIRIESTELPPPYCTPSE